MRKGYLKLATNLAKLCSHSSFLWKVEFVNIEAGYLAEEISKQRVEGMNWLLLTAYSKMWEERNELKEFFSKKEPELNILENIHSVHIAKNNKVCLEENTEGLSLDK